MVEDRAGDAESRRAAAIVPDGGDEVGVQGGVAVESIDLGFVVKGGEKCRFKF